MATSTPDSMDYIVLEILFKDYCVWRMHLHMIGIYIYAFCFSSVSMSGCVLVFFVFVVRVVGL